VSAAGSPIPFLNTVFTPWTSDLARPIPGRAMLDVVYIAATLVFFGLMLAYVRGCARLGRDQ